MAIHSLGMYAKHEEKKKRKYKIFFMISFDRSLEENNINTKKKILFNCLKWLFKFVSFKHRFVCRFWLHFNRVISLKLNYQCEK